MVFGFRLVHSDLCLCSVTTHGPVDFYHGTSMLLVLWFDLHRVGAHKFYVLWRCNFPRRGRNTKARYIKFKKASRCSEQICFKKNLRTALSLLKLPKRCRRKCSRRRYLHTADGTKGAPELARCFSLCMWPNSYAMTISWLLGCFINW